MCWNYPASQDFVISVSLVADFLYHHILVRAGVLMYFSYSLLKKPSRLIWGGGIFTKTGSQGRGVDFNVPEMIIWGWMIARSPLCIRQWSFFMPYQCHWPGTVQVLYCHSLSKEITAVYSNTYTYRPFRTYVYFVPFRGNIPYTGAISIFIS